MQHTPGTEAGRLQDQDQLVLHYKTLSQGTKKSGTGVWLHECSEGLGPEVHWQVPAPSPQSLTLPLLMQTYDIQASLQKDSQVTVSIILENQSNSFLKNMELSVLDSLNTKMARPEGSSVHDGVPVPFQLPPGEPTLRPWPVLCHPALLFFYMPPWLLHSRLN